MATEPNDGVRKLQRALELYLDQPDRADADSQNEVLSDHEDLRELLEPMLEDDSGAEQRVLPDARTLDDYRLIREIGRGGMGVVHEAEQLSLKRRVALKLLPPLRALNPTAIRRFRREAETAASLDHPGIVKVFAIGLDEEAQFFAMEFIEGAPMNAVIANLSATGWDGLDGARVAEAVRSQCHHQRDANAPPAAAQNPNPWPGSFVTCVAEIGIQLAQALAHAHDAGVVHRDVKPANILLRPDGRAVLTDFGLARQDDAPAMTRTGEFAGTPYYAAPEQISGTETVGPRADVFSLGATLYELLCLRRPFDGSSWQDVLKCIAHRDPPEPHRTNRQIPSDLSAIVMKALEKDVHSRYQDAAQLADDLRSFRDHKPVSARHLTPLARSLRWARREPLKTALALVLLAGAVLGAYYIISLEPLQREGAAARQERLVDEALIEYGFSEYSEGSLDAAGQAFRRALAIDPESRLGIAGVAITLSRFRKHAEALSWLANRDALVQETPALRRLRARLLHRQGRKREAAALAAELGEPRTGLDLFLCAMHEVDEGHGGDTKAFHRARQLIERAILSGESRAVVFFERAHIAGHLVPDAEAAEQAARAIESRYTDAPLGWYWVGYLYSRVDPARAVAAYQRAIDLAADTPLRTATAWFNLGRCREMGLQDKPGARAAYERALALRPEFAEALDGLGRLAQVERRWKDAEGFFRRALKQKSTSVETLANLGAALLDGGNARAAIDPLKRALAIDKRHSIAWESLARAHKALGAKEEALAAAQKAWNYNPKSARIAILLGYLLTELGDVDAGMEKYETALALDPDLPLAATNLANAYYNRGNYRDAARLYRQASELDPKNYEYLANLGLALRMDRQFDEALDALVAAEKLSPKAPLPAFNRGLVFVGLGRPRDAIAAFRRAEELDAKFIPAPINVGLTLLDSKQPANQAEAAFQRALDINPKSAEAAFEIAHGLRLRQLWRKAQPFYQRALRTEPNHLRAARGLATVLIRAGDLPTAVQWLRTAVRRHKGSANLWSQFAVAYARQGQRRLALGAVANAESLEPDDTQTLFNMGLALQAFDEMEKAEKVYRRALNSTPGHAQTASNLATLLLGDGRAENAEAMVKRAVENAPLFVNGWLVLGQARLHQGDYSGAVDALEKASLLAGRQRQPATRRQLIDRLLRQARGGGK